MTRRTVRPGRRSRFSTATIILCLQRYPGTDNSVSGIASIRYDVQVDGQIIGNGATGNDGVIRLRVDPSKRVVLLMLNSEYRLRVKTGTESISSTKGIQRRLSGLGYELGKVDGVIGRHTDRSILQFQADNNLDPDGIAGRNTKSKLRSRFGT